MLQLAENLFSEEREREAFLQALLAGLSKEPALIVLQDKPEIRTFPRAGALAWQPDWIVRLSRDFRPGRHPLHDKGAYYALDFSSVFAASAMLALPNAPQRVLDLCAAPGGKAVFAWRAFRPDVLACNESLRKRAGKLIQNLDRCRAENAAVWSADPAVWGQRAPESFDLVIVDAPCSGQSLLAKGEDAPGCFMPANIDTCVGRQRRIVGHGIRCVRPGGALLYATCTYAVKENEKVMAWLLAQNPDLRAIELPHLAEFRSAHAEFPAYRLYPQSGLGAGAFVCLLQREGPAQVEWGPFESFPPIWRFGDPVSRPRPEPEPSAEEPPTPARNPRPAPTGRRPVSRARPGNSRGRRRR